MNLFRYGPTNDAMPSDGAPFICRVPDESSHCEKLRVEGKAAYKALQVLHLRRFLYSEPVALRSIARRLPEHAAKIAHAAKSAAAGDVLDSGIRRFHKKNFGVVDTDSAQVVHDGLAGDALERGA